MSLTNKEIQHFADQLPEGVKIVDIREQGSDVKDFNVWSFVEKYLPNYYQDDNVALSNDLQKIIDNEWEDSQSATNIHNDLITEVAYSNGWDVTTLAKDKLAIVNAKIYQKAIEGFIEFMKGGQDA